jgi:hypothetical protein
MEYPTLRGWTPEAVRDLLESDDRIEDIAPLAMIQSWYFFGLWEAALGLRMESKSFIFPTETGPKIGSKALEGVIQKFKMQLFGVSPFSVANSESTGSATGSKTLRRLRQRLRDSVLQFRYTPETRRRLSAMSLAMESSSNHLILLQMKECRDVAQSTWRDLVQFSLASREAVRTVFRDLYYSCDRNPSKNSRCFQRIYRDVVERLSPTYDTITEETSHAIEMDLAESGWCPYLSRILASGAASISQFASLIGPLHDPLSTHAVCSRDHCAAENVEVAHAKPLHRVDGCSCHYIKVGDVDRNVLAMIEAGKLPLVNIYAILGSQKENLEHFIEASASPEGSEFIAFTHVWSHGLVGHAETGLPSCQIKRLVTLVENYNQEHSSNIKHFWIDGLCVPKEPTTRSKAIDSMSSIYTRASATIILDRALETLNQKDFSLQEYYFYIGFSAWARRLWTLPEALRAQNLVLACEDGLFSMGELRESIDAQESRTCVEIFCFDRMSFLGPHPSVFEFKSITRQLKTRKTSRPADETLAIAPLLGLETQSLSILPDEDSDGRMRQFLILLQSVPRGIVFCCGRQRLSQPGFRWAPSRLLDTNWSYLATYIIRNDAKVTSEGLRARYPLLALRSPMKLQSLVNKLVIVRPSRRIFNISKTPEELAQNEDTLNVTHMIRGQERSQCASLYPAICVSVSPSSMKEFRFLSIHILEEGELIEDDIERATSGEEGYTFSDNTWEETEILIT